MANSIERYFRLMAKAPTLRSSGGRMWYPAADVYRTRDGWVVKIELAGVHQSELEVVVGRDTVHVAGCRKDSFCAEMLSCHQLEITYSHFEKTIQFPCPIEGVAVETDYRDGLLIISLRSPATCDE